MSITLRTVPVPAYVIKKIADPASAFWCKPVFATLCDRHKIGCFVVCCFASHQRFLIQHEVTPVIIALVDFVPSIHI